MSVPGQAWARWRVPLGYPVGLVCVLLARPTLVSVAIGSVFALLGLLVRGAAAGHLRRSEALAATGPYARTRNPLYLGSALLAAGFVVAGRSWIAAIVLAAYFGIFYPMVMRREEADLRLHYGAAFEEYARRVPLLLPRLRLHAGAGRTEFSFAQYVRNREYKAAVGVVAVLAILSAMALWRR